MKLIKCQDCNNPYLNNPSLFLKVPQSQITYEGKLYTKLSYEVKINTASRLIIIIQVIALLILSCFIALAFQSMRKLWFQAVKGVETVDVLILQRYSECTDIWMLIASNLNVRDLMSVRKTSINKKIIAEQTLVNHVNSGKITLADLKISTVTGLINFFGENCSQITMLNLQKFQRVTDADIKNISRHFTKLNHFLLRSRIITNESTFYLAEMIRLRSLDLSLCPQSRILAFYRTVKSLKALIFHGAHKLTILTLYSTVKSLKASILHVAVKSTILAFYSIAKS